MSSVALRSTSDERVVVDGAVERAAGCPVRISCVCGRLIYDHGVLLSRCLLVYERCAKCRDCKRYVRVPIDFSAHMNVPRAL